MKDGRESYFEAALSDFAFDVAAGGAIRHLTDRGYSVEQMMRELSYPVPRAKVEKAVYRYMTEARILLAKLPEENENLKIRCLEAEKGAGFAQRLSDAIAESGEKNAYMECPFGGWKKKAEKKAVSATDAESGRADRGNCDGEWLRQTFACLTGREQEYLSGIRWEQDVMYHRMNGRMREIALKLIKNTEYGWKFYFLTGRSRKDSVL